MPVRYTMKRYAYHLLLPLAPFLGWGPITHVYLHKKAMDDLKGNGPEGILKSEQDKEYFTNAGNITDLIKANQLRYKERYYEYAHNTIPTKFEGRPIFGERLWEENLRRGRRDGMVYSLAWICHQVSDQFPHRYPTDGYEGFVNARRFFAPYYPDDEDWSKRPKALRNDLISADHWLAEIFADLLSLSREADYFRSCKINLDFGDYPEIEDVSAKVIQDFHDELYPAVKYFIPLKPKIMLRVYRYYHLVLRVFLDMYFHFYESLGADKIQRLVNDYAPFSNLERMLDFSVQSIYDSIERPIGGWEPEKFKTPDPGPVRFSVYSYENYEGPERYDFGFRRGFLPWVAGLFFNSQLLNELAKRVADRMSTWGLIKPVMEIASKRRRSGMNITAYFLCELDDATDPSMDELVQKTVARFKLKEKGA